MADVRDLTCRPAGCRDDELTPPDQITRLVSCLLYTSDLRCDAAREGVAGDALHVRDEVGVVAEHLVHEADPRRSLRRGIEGHRGELRQERVSVVWQMCIRDRRSGDGPLVDRWLMPLTLPLYGVIFAENPESEVARNIKALSYLRPERVRMLVEDIERELTERTQPLDLSLIHI